MTREFITYFDTEKDPDFILYCCERNYTEIKRCKDCDKKTCETAKGNIICGLTGQSHPSYWFCADGAIIGEFDGQTIL